MTADTTDPSYWLNWRFFICAIWILIVMVVAAVFIWRYEGSKKSGKSQKEDDQQETAGSVYQDEPWSTCLKSIHPKWLLVYRLTAFCTLLALLLADIIVHGARILFFYTQWTFALVTIYFALGSAFSIHGCLHGWKEVGDGVADFDNHDSESGTYKASTLGDQEHIPSTCASLNFHKDPLVGKNAGFGGYTFQIVYQLAVCLHSVNAVFLLGEMFLNNLWFPFFRIAYFVLWTSLFVIFQWIIHMCVSLWWPYRFLDLSSQNAPLWYIALSLIQLPCYCIFALIIWAKQFLLSRLNP